MTILSDIAWQYSACCKMPPNPKVENKHLHTHLRPRLQLVQSLEQRNNQH